MRVSLADIHTAPDDPAPKLALAAQLAEWADPRGELIRAQEAFRRHPADRAAGDLCLGLAARILHSIPDRHRVLDRLYGLLEMRYLVTLEADCAQRVLWLFEAARPGDDRPRRAIQAARRARPDRSGFRPCTPRGRSRGRRRAGPGETWPSRRGRRRLPPPCSGRTSAASIH